MRKGQLFLQTFCALALGATLTLLAGEAAEAHTFGGAVGAGFPQGVAHPFGGLDHLLAMITVGLWAAQKGGKALWVIPATFMSAMVLGGALGMEGIDLPAVELGIAASLMALGSVVAFAFRPPLWIGMLLVGVFAVFHGHAHGAEMPEAASAILYGTGFLLATGALHGAGILFCRSIRRGALSLWADRAIRSAGAAVAVTGVLLIVS